MVIAAGVDGHFAAGKECGLEELGRSSDLCMRGH